MTLKYLLIISLLFPFICLPQSSTIGIKVNHYTKEIRIGDEIIKNEAPLISFNYIYSCSKKKDTIYIYKQTDLSNFDEIDRTNFVLTTHKKNDAVLTITKDDNSIKILKILFNDNLKSVNIDESSYFLNNEYYFYLKKNLNIPELTNLLDDFLQEDIYQMDDLKFINSKTKYKNKNFKVLNAKVKTTHSQNENIIKKWKIFYSYNKNNVLTSIKQTSKNEVRYTKTLLTNANNVLSYQIYWQVDERFSDDKKVTFDINQNIYLEKGTYLQVGLNKETDYETTIAKSIRETSKTLELNKKELTALLEKMN